MARANKEQLFKSWDDVNNALKLIAEIDQQIASAELTMNDRINQIKVDTENITREKVMRKEEMEKALKAFVKAHKKEFVDSKTKPFIFGEVGFRKVTSVVTKNAKAIIEALKRHRMVKCINTTETINKKELEKYDDEALEKVGVKRNVKENYFYKIYTERIEQ